MKYNPDYFEEAVDVLKEFVDRMNTLTPSGDAYYLSVPDDSSAVLEIGLLDQGYRRVI